MFIIDSVIFLSVPYDALEGISVGVESLNDSLIPRFLAIAYSGKTMEVPVKEKAKHLSEIHAFFCMCTIVSFPIKQLPYMTMSGT